MFSKYVFIAIFLLVFCLNVYAIQVGVPELSADKDSTVTVSIEVNDTTGIAAGYIVLEYDSAVLIAKEVRKADLTQSLTLIANTNVKGKVTLSFAGAKGLEEGSGAIVEVDFEVENLGESPLNLSDVVLYDGMGNDIPVETENGKIAVKEKPTKKSWDVNDDDVVNIFDLVMVGSHFGESGDEVVGDVNNDGQVDIFDLVIVGRHFGEKIAAPSIHSISLLQQIYDILKTVPNPNQNLKLALIEIEKLLVPKETELMQNYPNPFNPETWIPFQLAFDGNVSITIYDVLGSVICTLDVGWHSAGIYVSKEKAVYWDGRNDEGEKAPSGVYFYTLQAGSYSSTTKRMLILK